MSEEVYKNIKNRYKLYNTTLITEQNGFNLFSETFKDLIFYCQELDSNSCTNGHLHVLER